MLRKRQARSSMAERCRYLAEAGGSIPSAPTIPDPVRARQRATGMRCGAEVLAVSACLTLALLGCGAPGSSAAVPAPKASAQPTSEYVIGPGDMLGIFVYRAPE